MKPVIETLESRIAPANIFFNPEFGTFTDAKGKAEKSDLSATASSGATFALLLGKNDTLIMDSTVTKTGKGKKQQQVVDGDSIQLASVSSGSALLFFTDLNKDSRVGAGEITGLAAGDKLKGSVNADINGSVTTAFGGKGKKAAFQGGNLLDESITELRVTGKVTGHLLAGSSISGVTVGGTEGDFSVKSIATGNAAAGITISFNGGAKTFTSTAPVVKSGNGGSIQSVTLAQGTQSIQAGAGIGGGDGGSIGGVTINAQNGDLSIIAGAGSTDTKGSGGNGGSVTNVKISGLVGDLSVVAGAGADGGESLSSVINGGNGGNVTDVQVASVASGAISVTAGEGGYGGYAYKGYNYFGGNGGSGGAVDNVTITIASNLETLDVTAGAGAGAQVNKSGGNGGSVTKLTVNGSGVIAEATVLAGDAGEAGSEGGAGGKGGDITTVRLAAETVTLTAGDGASSSGPVGAAPGGNGGSVTDIRLTQVSGSVDIAAGNAGDAGYSEKSGTYIGAVGGTGGSIRNVSIEGAGSDDGEFNFAAGSGGDGTGNRNGGAGGTVSEVTITLTDTLDELSVTAGAGGNSGGTGVGGAGGGVAAFNVNADAILGLAKIVAGSGGAGVPTAGGAGGSLNVINLDAGEGGWGVLEPVFTAGVGGTGTPAGANGTVGASVRSNYEAPEAEEELVPVA